MTELLPRETTNQTSDDDDLHHFYCCDKNRAMCGKDLTSDHEEDTSKAQHICVVCTHLDHHECEVCGQ